MAIGKIKETCPHCGQSIEGRWEKLTPGLVNSLHKFMVACDRNRTGYAHLQRDCGLTKSEYTNFYRLKFWGLARRTANAGYWQIEEKGRLFLKNLWKVHKQLFVFNNAIQKTGDQTVDVKEVMKSTPYWLKKDDYQERMAPAKLPGKGLFDE